MPLLPPALRVRVFRWYWAAQWPTQLGTWMHIVALGYLVYSTTHSTTAVALVAAADGIPVVALSLFGGLLADRWPRRRILLATQSILGITMAALAVLAATGHAGLPVILVFAVIFGCTNDAIDLPARQALIADIVDRSLILNAMALSSSAMSATRIVGPSLAGIIIAAFGPAFCFGFLAVAYLAPIVALLLVIPDIAPTPDPARRGALRDLVAGLVVAWRTPLLRGALVCGGVLALLGVSYMPYLPAIASSQLHTSPQGLGLMYSIGGVGGLVGGLLLGTLRSSRRRHLLGVGAVLYGISLFAVGRSTSLAITLPALVGISFGFVAINTSLTTLIQTESEARMRGRLLGLYATVFAGSMPIGTLLYGAVANLVGLGVAISTGALAVGGTALLVALSGALRTADDPATPGETPAAEAANLPGA
jgi:predicted MFS family arabinose efflux permease